jgi:hypothetical protein
VKKIKAKIAIAHFSGKRVYVWSSFDIMAYNVDTSWFKFIKFQHKLAVPEIFEDIYLSNTLKVVYLYKVNFKYYQD